MLPPHEGAKKRRGKEQLHQCLFFVASIPVNHAAGIAAVVMSSLVPEVTSVSGADIRSFVPAVRRSKRLERIVGESKGAAPASAVMQMEEEAEDRHVSCRIVVDTIADHLLCPITHELPLVPVIAEDGNIYERSAIERWFSEVRRSGMEVRSPVTNQTMGEGLLPAVQVRNVIRSMVESEQLTKEKSTAWRKLLKDEQYSQQLRSKAEAGDTAAMVELGIYHSRGTRGLVKDKDKAFHYFKAAADRGSVHGLVKCALFYLRKACAIWENEDLTVPSDCVLKQYGIHLMERAARKGSEEASYYIGRWYEKGTWFDFDAQLALHWYKRMAESSEKILCRGPQAESAREHAAAYVRSNSVARVNARAKRLRSQ